MGKRVHARPAIAAALLLLAGCGSNPSGPAQVDIRSGAGAGPGAASGNCGRAYTVRDGDTLSGVAARCSVSFAELASENRLSAPYPLRTGQVLQIPGPATYRVQPGQNLYRIALAHGMSIEEMASLNGLRAPYTIYPGQELQVRGQARPQQLAASSARPPSPPSQARSNPQRVEFVQPSQPPAARPAPPPASTAAPVAGAPTFDWPLRGEVLSRFGPQAGSNERRDGWTIAARAGQSISAAADGEVVYAGNELQGYGELVLLRHSGNFVTAYAHNSRLLVAVGDQVRQGQQIAEAGATGNADRVQLYFEIRRGVSPVDPAGYLN